MLDILFGTENKYYFWTTELGDNYLNQYGNTFEKDDEIEALKNETDEDKRDRIVDAARTFQSKYKKF